MLLYHATLRRNLPSILRDGILAERSEGAKPVVWLTAAYRRAWALLHTVSRHGGRIEDTVSLEVDVPRSWLRRFRRGLWYTWNDVPVSRIRVVSGFRVLAYSEATDYDDLPTVRR